jgi:DNA repair ATPase RecN
MTLDLETLVAPIISVIVAVIVSWMAMSTKLAVLETKLDDLSEDVRKHNNLVERMARIEISDKAQWERLDERRDECHELQKEVGDLKHKMATYHH